MRKVVFLEDAKGVDEADGAEDGERGAEDGEAGACAVVWRRERVRGMICLFLSF